MQWYLSQVKQLQSSFEVFSIKQVPRSRNAYANSLATLTTSLGEGLPRVITYNCGRPSGIHNGVNTVHFSPSEMDPMVSFLKDGTLPEDKMEAEKTRRKALWYWLSEEQKLYKWPQLGPYLLCVHSKAVEVFKRAF